MRGKFQPVSEAHHKEFISSHVFNFPSHLTLMMHPSEISAFMCLRSDVFNLRVMKPLSSRTAKRCTCNDFHIQEGGKGIPEEHSSIVLSAICEGFYSLFNRRRLTIAAVDRRLNLPLFSDKRTGSPLFGRRANEAMLLESTLEPRFFCQSYLRSFWGK